MTDTIDNSPSQQPGSLSKSPRSPWRRHLWRVAQATREERAAQEIADQLAAPRLALWQQRHRQRPLNGAVSSPEQVDDVICLIPAVRERS